MPRDRTELVAEETPTSLGNTGPATAQRTSAKPARAAREEAVRSRDHQDALCPAGADLPAGARRGVLRQALRTAQVTRQLREKTKNASK